MLLSRVIVATLKRYIDKRIYGHFVYNKIAIAKQQGANGYFFSKQRVTMLYPYG